MRRSSVNVLAVLVACSSSACGESKRQAETESVAKPAAEPVKAASVEPPLPNAQPSAKPPSEVDRARQAVQKLAREDEAQRLLDAWVAAQNAGDFERYGALYAERFVGVKRKGELVQQFAERADWLADRKRMFKQRIHVELAGQRIRSNDNGVAIRFVQHFSTGKFQDVGPKQLVLLAQQDGTLRIAKEEMLGSTVVGQLASRDARQFAFLTQLRGRVAIQIEPPAQPYPLEGLLSEGAIDGQEDGDELAISGLVAATAQSSQLAAWRGARVRLFGTEGVECVATVEQLLIATRYADRTFSGWADYWLDDEGKPRTLAEPEMLEELRSEGAFLAAALDLDLASDCAKKTAFARAADLPQSVALQDVKGTPELTRAVMDAVVKTASYAHTAPYAAEKYELDLREETHVAFYGLPGRVPQFAWAVARDGCPCWSCDVSLDVVCKIEAAGDAATVTVVDEPNWDNGEGLTTMVDANATGDFRPVVFQALGNDCFEHPKLRACTYEILSEPSAVSEAKPP